MANASASHDELPNVLHTAGRALRFERSKMAIWLFLASEVIFFSALIGLYSVYAPKAVEIGDTVVHFTENLTTILIVSVNTFLLLTSSWTVVMSLAASREGKAGQRNAYLLATLLLGAIFLGVQMYEYSNLINHEGVSLGSGLFGTAFFTLTGFHGLHVFIGLVWAIPLLIGAVRDRLPMGEHSPIEVFGLYWHFVDVVWIVLFTIVYLVPLD